MKRRRFGRSAALFNGSMKVNPRSVVCVSYYRFWSVVEAVLALNRFIIQFSLVFSVYIDWSVIQIRIRSVDLKFHPGGPGIAKASERFVV